MPKISNVGKQTKKQNPGDGAGKGIEILSTVLNCFYFLSYIWITK